jgi:ubiquinone/menaquinone biosynthesis C-methylase UbiE
MADVHVHDTLRANYDDYYDSGPSEWRRLGAVDKADNVVALCGSLPHESILEIGAGDGSVLSRLSDLGFGAKLSAVEISESGVEVIQRRRIPRLVECRLFDGSSLPYETDSFDLAVLSHVVEHVEHPRQILYEAARVARHVFIEVPLEDISRRPEDYHPDRVGHINFFSRRTIRWLVQSCELRVLAQATTNPSKGTYVYQGGRKGLLQYHVKQLLLDCAPRLAVRHFCYHESLVAAKITRT